MPIDMKNIISETFMTMVQKKGIDKITVKALIDACNISRQTFYYHFQDIMEVIEWSMERATQKMLAAQPGNGIARICDRRSYFCCNGKPYADPQTTCFSKA